MPGLNDPNDPSFTDPSQNGYWKWNAQNRRWEPDPAKDAVNSFLFGLPDQLGLRAQSIPAGAPGSELNLGWAGDDRARMAGLLSQLRGQAETGGGAWEQALKQNTEANNNAAMAIGQTLGGDAMSASRAIGNARAGNEQRAVGQGNLLRAQSQQQAQGQLADILSGQGALDAQTAAGQAAAKQGMVQANRSLESSAAAARRNLVGAAGQAAVGGMSDGGEVPGKAPVFGDDERNDVVPAKLSPGEIVIPRSIALAPDAPERAAAFVAAVQGRGNPNQTNFAPGGEIDDGSDALPTGGGVPNQRVRAATGPMPTASQLDPLASQTMEPSVANGALLDTRPYASMREAALGNADNFMTQFLGGGPSVAPQAMQNATDSTIADAFRARGPGVTGAAAEQLQGAAGNAAGLVAGETQRGAASFAEAVQKQRAQDIAFATAQQQAAWRNALMNAGVGLEQQAQLRNLLGGAGQGAIAMGGMFDMDKPSNSYHYDTGTGRYDTTPAYEAPTASAPGEWEQPFAEGGVVARLSRKGTRPAPKRPAEGMQRTKRQLPEGEAIPAEDRQRVEGMMEKMGQLRERERQDEAAKRAGDLSDFELNYAGGGPVPFFDVSGVALPQRGPFTPPPQQPQGIPGALEVLKSLLRPPGGPNSSLPEPRMMAPEEIAAADQRNAEKAAARNPEPPLRHSPDMTQRPFVTPASRAPMPPVASPAAPQKPSAPQVDPYAEQKKAAGMKAEAEGAMATEQAGVLQGLQSTLEQNAIAQKEAQARAREQAEAGLAQIQMARDELKNIDTNVDTGRYWADRGIPGKISAIIGLALGAIGNDNGVNRAAQLLNQAIDRDIDAQKASLAMALRKGQSAVDSAQNIYALTRQMTQDDIAANLAAKGTALDLAKNQVDIAAAKAGAPLAKANLAALSAQIDMEKRKADEALRQRNFDNAIKAGHLALERQAAGAKPQGKQLPAEVVVGLSEVPVAMRQLDSLGKTFADKATGFSAKASSMLPDAVGRALGTDVADYNAQALQVMQGVGKIMEGGKLAAGDEEKYKRMLPRAGDDKELAKQKINQAKAFLNDLVETRKRTLAESGFNVPGLAAPEAAPAKRLMRLPSGEVVEVR